MDSQEARIISQTESCVPLPFFMENIRLYTLDQCVDISVHAGFGREQGRVLFSGLWYKGGRSFNEIHGLKPDFVEQLNRRFFIPDSRIAYQQRSTDGTIKCSVALNDGNLVEAVLIPAGKRMTVCVSSQVGCSLSCSFCATGMMERKRNLYAFEIHDQVFLLNQMSLRHYGIPVSNVVFMGMGEPLLNLREVLQGISFLQDQRGLSIAPRRITISTAGIAKMIRTLADDGRKLNLALSLHAANDAKRNEIMAINESNNLGVLKEALAYFAEKTRNEITLEYILLHEVNDTPEDAAELLDFYHSVPVRLINLIEYNPTGDGLFRSSGQERTDAFARFLLDNGVNASLRRSRGKDIDAACGQLAAKSSEDY